MACARGVREPPQRRRKSDLFGFIFTPLSNAGMAALAARALAAVCQLCYGRSLAAVARACLVGQACVCVRARNV